MALKEGVRMRAKRLNGGHLILNCSDSGVTPLVTSLLDGALDILDNFSARGANRVFHI